MRKIEERMIDAVENGFDFYESNTMVENRNGITNVYLYGHCIMQFDRKSGMKRFSDAGWQTNTTKSRLNALGCNVCQRNFSFIWPKGIERF